MPYVKEIRTRVLWLLIGLGLSLGIAEVIKTFDSTLEQNLLLVSFIPLVVYMSDAAGTQMEAIIIRGLHTKGKFHFMKFIGHQAVVVSAVALIIGAVSGIAVTLLHNSSELGLVIGISLVIGIMTSLFTGSLLPYFFWRLHNDPAEAGGPIATVIQDFLSVIIFFSAAKLIM